MGAAEKWAPSLAGVISAERLVLPPSNYLRKWPALPGVVIRAVDATIGWCRFGERAAHHANGWWRDARLPVPEANLFFHEHLDPKFGWKRFRVDLDLNPINRVLLHEKRKAWWPAAQTALVLELRNNWFDLVTDEDFGSCGGMPPALFAAVACWWEARAKLYLG